jgi:hypothetical protein
MDSDTADRLAGIVSSLGEHMDTLDSCGLREARQLLSVVKLDLQMRIHGISDHELRALCEVLERQQYRQLPGNVIAFTPRQRKKKSG